MQRQLYPVLLVFAVTLALAVCLRPSVAEELMTLAQGWGEPGPWSGQVPAQYPTSLGGSSIPGPPHRPIPTTRAVPIPPTRAPSHASPTRETVVPDAYYEPQAPVRRVSYPSTDGHLPPVGSMPPTTGPNGQAPPMSRPTGPQIPVAAGPPFPQASQAGPTPHTPYPRPQAAPKGPQAPPTTLCEGAQILAQVGSDVVLASELSATVNEILEKNKDRIPPEHLEQQRMLLVKQFLKQRIQFKLIYQDAKRSIPEENLNQIRERLAEQFDKVVIPERIERSGLGSRRELDEMLGRLGTSLSRERRGFVEQTMAQQWAREQVGLDKEISHAEMLGYYQENLDDYKTPARARWQQLTARKSSYGTQAEAVAALASWGNQIVGGVPFEQVAKKHSEGVTASDGGLRDWTTEGSLVSQLLDDAIFGLPPNQLSRIIEDDRGFHIIRVVERQEATITPFLEAQVDIKEQLTELHSKGQLDEYLADLERQIPVWTVFDEEDPVHEVSQRTDSWFQ